MRTTSVLRILCVFALGLTLVACGDDDEELPPDGGPSIRDLGTDQGPTDGGDIDLAFDGGSVDAGPSDAGTDAEVPDADAPDGGCVGAGGCWSCAPGTPTQFLNACTTAECSPFNNGTRLPLLNADGTLPPLP